MALAMAMLTMAMAMAMAMGSAMAVAVVDAIALAAVAMRAVTLAMPTQYNVAPERVITTCPHAVSEVCMCLAGSRSASGHLLACWKSL